MAHNYGLDILDRVASCFYLSIQAVHGRVSLAGRYIVHLSDRKLDDTPFARPIEGDITGPQYFSMSSWQPVSYKMSPAAACLIKTP
jgi:hypothetical protein